MSQADTPSPAPHKPPDEAEQVYFDGSPVVRSELFKAVVWTVFGLFLISLPILAKIYKSSFWNNWLAIGCVIVGVLVIVIPVLRIRATRYRITNYRIDYEFGILGRQADTLELWHVEDISLHQTILDRILNTGQITVISTDHVMPHLVMRGLPDPRPIFDSLKQRIIAVKRQRGVIKMDM